MTRGSHSRVKQWCWRPLSCWFRIHRYNLVVCDAIWSWQYLEMCVTIWAQATGSSQTVSPYGFWPKWFLMFWYNRSFLVFSTVCVFDTCGLWNSATACLSKPVTKNNGLWIPTHCWYEHGDSKLERAQWLVLQEEHVVFLTRWFLPTDSAPWDCWRRALEHGTVFCCLLGSTGKGLEGPLWENGLEEMSNGYTVIIVAVVVHMRFHKEHRCANRTTFVKSWFQQFSKQCFERPTAQLFWENMKERVDAEIGGEMKIRSWFCRDQLAVRSKQIRNIFKHALLTRFCHVIAVWITGQPVRTPRAWQCVKNSQLLHVAFIACDSVLPKSKTI